MNLLHSCSNHKASYVTNRGLFEHGQTGKAWDVCFCVLFCFRLCVALPKWQHIRRCSLQYHCAVQWGAVSTGFDGMSRYHSFTFTFMHLADAFIQSDLHCIQVTVFTFLSALAFPGNRTHDLGIASAMLYYLSYRKPFF